MGLLDAIDGIDAGEQTRWDWVIKAQHHHRIAPHDAPTHLHRGDIHVVLAEQIELDTQFTSGADQGEGDALVAREPSDQEDHRGGTGRHREFDDQARQRGRFRSQQTERVTDAIVLTRRTAEARAAVLSRAIAMAEGQFDAQAPLDRWFTRSAEDAPLRAQAEPMSTAMLALR